MNVAPNPISSVLVNGTRVELLERGAGKPVLFLHPGIGLRSMHSAAAPGCSRPPIPASALPSCRRA